MRNGHSHIRQELSDAVACHETQRFVHATEIRAVKCGRYPGIGAAAGIAHAGETIADNFGIGGRCVRGLDECERGGCDGPTNSLHDCLPWDWPPARSSRYSDFLRAAWRSRRLKRVAPCAI